MDIDDLNRELKPLEWQNQSEEGSITFDMAPAIADSYYAIYRKGEKHIVYLLNIGTHRVLVGERKHIDSARLLARKHFVRMIKDAFY